MISNQQLRQAFLSPQMKYYFDKKLAPLPSPEIDARIEETLKYLNLSVHSEGDIPFSKEIGEVWCHWVLETAEYSALCDKLPRGRFIHHSSNEYVEYLDEGIKNKRIGLARGLAFLSAYVLNYGPFEADRLRYWPVAEHLMRSLGWGLDTFNHWLASMHHKPTQPTAAERAVALELAVA
ncbi:MAG: hypothetical protein EOP38_07030 [Rubrivivax sp.]|nr:MAG: hypothetical protein EOP38_07030 [Rubrivivax sp.]